MSAELLIGFLAGGAACAGITAWVHGLDVAARRGIGEWARSVATFLLFWSLLGLLIALDYRAKIGP